MIGTGALGLTGSLAYAAYRAAPAFWGRFAEDMGREIAPAPNRPNVSEWPDKGLYAAWLGHSTVLLKIDGFTILTDPVLGDKAGIDLRLFTLGVKRLVEPAVDLAGLPKIDLILSSHAHMDHLDTPTLGALESKDTHVVMAHATSDLVRVKRYGSVQELRWGSRTRVGPASVRAFEVNHWGARMRTDTYRGYNGYLLDVGRWRVLFAGDTADTDKFRALHDSRGIDLAIIPIGAYNPWIWYHCNPEQAWRMGNEAGVELFLPVHHQTFTLSREPNREPIERFLNAAGSSASRILWRDIGGEVRLS
jgi:L-ascorbate metabolism protein UlaG (beta-lactamase superfamily)